MSKHNLMNYITASLFPNGVNMHLLDIYFLKQGFESWEGLRIYVLKGVILKSLIKPQFEAH